MLKPILFLDVNGTILDDWEPSFAGVVGVLDYYGVKPPTMSDYIREVGVDGDYHGFYLRRGVTASRDDLYAHFLPAYIAHADEIRIVPGVHSALEQIRHIGMEIHILTAARKDFIEPILIESHIHELCDSYHYHIHSKSAQVDAVLVGSDIEPSRCALAGDIPADVLHGKRAGVRGIGFRNPHVPKELFSSLHSMDFYAFSFTGLANYLALS